MACPSDELLAAFVGRELQEAPRAECESHLAMCSQCESAVSLLVLAFAEEQTSPPAARPQLPSPGDEIGRYRVLEWIGAGAMGAVFSAFDPELQRRVALKIVQPRPGTAGDADRARFVSEAQATATIRHPHVVAVHEVGVHEHLAFLAMEFVEGMTLRQWLSHPRSVAEILEKFVAAGQGLAAAHARGLVHRDFKPDNVLVGDDGRVQVIDFGLAHFTEHFVPEHSEEANAPVSVTRTGALLGTPAYMPPEQLAGGHIDARSDQFAFCVSLYEALCGERPFRGRTVDELRATAGRMPPSWVPRDRALRPGRIPGRVRTAVERGLAVDSDERFEGIEALVRRLQPRRWGGWAGAAGLAVGAGGLAAGLYGASSGATAPSCPPSAQRLDGVWDAQVHQQLEASLGTKLASARWLVDELDTYASSWVAQHHESCAATVVRHEQSEQAMDRRMACLQRAISQLDATVEVVLEQPQEALSRAPHLVAALDPPRGCTEIDPARLPAAADGRNSNLTRAIDRIKALQAAGRDDEVFASLAELEPRVDEAGDDRLHAQIQHLRAKSKYTTGNFKEAAVVMADALEQALATEQYAVASGAAGSLTCMHNDLGAFHVAQAYAKTALGLIGAAEEEHPQRGAAYRCIGRLAHVRGEYREAERWFKRAIVENERRYGKDHVVTAADKSSLARTMQFLGDMEGAMALHRQALSVTAASLGEQHPRTAGVRSRLVSCLMSLQRFEEAEAEALAAVQAWSLAGGSNPRASTARLDLAHVYFQTRRFEEAEVEYRKAIDDLLAAVGPNSPVTLAAEASLAGLLYVQKRSDEARSAFEGVLPRMRQVMGPHHSKVLQTELSLVRLEQMTGFMAETIDPLETLSTSCADSDKSRARTCARIFRMLAIAILEVNGDWSRAERAWRRGQQQLDLLSSLPKGVQSAFDDLRAKIDKLRPTPSPLNSDGLPQAFPAGLPDLPGRTFTLSYDDFGPQSAAFELIGMRWWQWESGGSWDNDDDFEIPVIVYRGIDRDAVEARYPTVRGKSDYRLVAYDDALRHLDSLLATQKDSGLHEPGATLGKTRERIVAAFQ
ncbi:MAG: serine/threonine protein kinase [Nannocystaceae bacterium]|nr:serine/threonine protein kinase [Nannocystaceae bacterium]